MDFEPVTTVPVATNTQNKFTQDTTNNWRPGPVLLFIFALIMSWALPGLSAQRIETLTDETDARTPLISIIIDDIGYSYERDKRAIILPGPISYAFLPHTPHSVRLANLAHAMKKEVLLHQPMQANAQLDPGPGALMLDMTRTEFDTVLRGNIDSIPHVIGINNHMGSLLTRHPGHMRWLMETVRRYQDLFFVDSFTTKTSVIRKVANENWVPNIRRDVFLDDDRNPQQILQQFRRLLHTAEANGIALGIAHPYPETVSMLEQQLPTLHKKGYRLVPISKLLNRHKQRFRTWRAFLSP